MFYIIIIIYTILFLYNIIKLKKYNTNSRILYIENINDIENELNSLNPIVSSYMESLSFNELLNINPTYIIKDNKRFLSLKSFNEESQIYLHKNKQIINDLYLKPKLCLYLFKDPYYLIDKSISLYKGNIITNTIKCENNYTIIHIIHGETIFYLFNPKHILEIKDKPLHKIKKWAYKIQLKRFQFLIIPSQWCYIQESEKETIQYELNIYNYFTIFSKYIY
tara:strand:+ start:610 stop:1275 length:666 start_codon:yes stop_codon:yes gene_type:complete